MKRAAAAVLALAFLPALSLPARAADEGSDSEWQRYIKRAGTLRKYHGKGTLKDEDVLKVLRDAGVFQTVASATDGGAHRSFATGFREFKVRVYHGLWIWPLRAGVVSSEFGKRWGKQHQGIDIAADTGDPVTAAAPGEVLYADDKLRGYGKVVILRHDEKTTSIYAHNDRLLVRQGDKVRTGQRIALVGSTGHSTGPHLHFEVRKEQKPQDPRKLLPKSRF
ncbi:MAG TPA: hypothetical protein DD417_07405 [Elusimicrobia bacterium]|nr:hypothetical protein [Elusimicrobiota bacterium]